MFAARAVGDAGPYNVLSLVPAFITRRFLCSSVGADDSVGPIENRIVIVGADRVVRPYEALWMLR